jgi:hypothetical protein
VLLDIVSGIPNLILGHSYKVFSELGQGKIEGKLNLSKYCISAFNGFRKVKFCVCHFSVCRILLEPELLMKLFTLNCVG